ncbi:aspartate ammonia-lyase [Anaerococcus sp. NML200574]|uniref:aspartate ammonia-lyase n=1 Tax=Anaerococcus sp. NML200574 TaxID=2954486 RepID=UPI002237DC4A|nr:aspartate ammonia-lyase [Anaerococcus sp. NML200574]MCW6678970.1 aspartate ammonia-lyase [Anaerococcus sp. NML200574]
MSEFRLERDSLGELNIPKDAYYGANSYRAYENFKITDKAMDPYFIKAIVEVKKACAILNNKVGILSDKKMQAIVDACDEILAGKYLDQFIVDPIQGGAGTSFNMNANEVIANIANLSLGGSLGHYEHIHPNDHVNLGQSTNDVIPTAGKVAIIRYMDDLYEEVEKLVEAFDKKSKEFDEYIKMGRTQLQDAVPITLGQEFNAYKRVVKRGLKRFKAAKKELSYVNLGGTAIGTGLNADYYFVENIVTTLSDITGLDLNQANDLIDATQNLDGFLFTSSVLKTFAASLSKVANDLRLLSSGPTTGISDFKLPAKQAGSSIMPGKVNPVIPEVVNQVAFLVIGNDMTVTMAVEAGQLELNAFEPVIFYSLIESITALKGAISTLTLNCVEGITANKEKLRRKVENSVAIITPFAPHIGYDAASAIAKESMKSDKSVRELILEKGLMDEAEIDKILDYKRMTRPGILDEEHMEKN